MRTCIFCGHEIHPDRLELLPNTNTCAEHSTVRKAVGFMEFSHKTAPSVVLVSGSDREGQRRAQRAFKRAR